MSSEHKSQFFWGHPVYIGSNNVICVAKRLLDISKLL